MNAISRRGWAGMIGLCILFISGVAQGQPILADYDAEVRGADGRVDVPVLVQRLVDLQLNTYFYLVWHRDTDWEDLKLLLPAAQTAGIDIWVYLVPPSESPPHTSRYSEPFRLDYVRWGEEIARLSLTYANLKAFVIDDFWANRAFFTPSYVRLIRTRMHAITPNLTFWPLMYYREIDRTFVLQYQEIIDGVVAAYPRDATVIEQAWRMLNDRQDEPAAWSFSYPGNTRSRIGDFAAIHLPVAVEKTDRHTVFLTQQDSYEGPTAGYHFKELLIDGHRVWEEDVAGGERIWQTIAVDVSARVADRSEALVTFRMFDRKPVSNFVVTVDVQEPVFEGLRAASGATWQIESLGRWAVAHRPAYRSQGGFHIPLVVMIAGARSQFVKRWGDPASPERIRDKVKMALVTMRRGFAEGVVTYALFKEPGDPVYDAIRRLFLKASLSAHADFDGNGRVDFEDFLLFAQGYGKDVGEFATVDAAFDLDLDTHIGFGDFLLFVQAFNADSIVK